MTRRRSRAPADCAQCGTPIPPGAAACPECGADEKTGWDAGPDDIDEGALDIPDYLTEDYDPEYDGPVLPGESSGPRGLRLLAALAALLAIFAVAFALS